jgi:hypothetical protein
MLEDHAKMDNVLTNNLVAVTRKVANRIRDEETDVLFETG